MRNFFTLIELIVVIAVLGILAAIIIPNISSFQEEANETAIQSNVRNLQTSVDMYGLENYGAVPTSDIPLEDVPQPIDFNKVYPDYTRDLPETEGVKYWVDFQGKVWASTIDSPSDVTYNPGTLEWTGVENAAYYNIFKVVDNDTSSSIKNKKTIFIKKLEDSSANISDTTLPNLQAGEQYLVNAVDKKGFESAPVGTNYNGYVEVPFVGGQSSDALVPVGTNYTFNNANNTGSSGPSQSQLNAAYINTVLEGKVTSNNGIQVWTVPESGTYRIEAYGAQGGYAQYSGVFRDGGTGAIMKGNFNLSQGDKIRILVGQRGGNHTQSSSYGGGGGGGTFVTKVDSNSAYTMFDSIRVKPLVVAGGGGGGTATYQHPSNDYSGGDATTTNNGTNRGTKGSYAYTGAASFNMNNDGGDAKSFLSGGQGGIARGGSHLTGFGGFGGAAGAHHHPGGGGGGYSGGNGGFNHSYTVATGGGSYNGGSSQSNSVGHTGHGKVVITRVN